MMDVVMANNAKKIGNGNVKRTATASLIMAQKSLFSAGARDLANTLGVAHTQNASSMEQMVNEANLTSYDTEMAKMLSTFGSGSGSGGNAFDQHAKRTSYNQALEKEMDKKKRIRNRFLLHRRESKRTTETMMPPKNRNATKIQKKRI